jgi:UDP-glucose 4-epimerase
MMEKSRPIRKLVVIGARSNLTQAIQRCSEAIVVPSAELTVPNGASALPKNLPFIINAFQPATQLGNLSNPVEYIERSLGVLAQSLKWARDAECSRVVYSSSAVVYGENPNCKESDPVQILGLHSSLKVAAEQLVSSFCEHSGLDFTIMRPFNLFGGQDKFSVIHRLEYAAHSHTVFILVNHGIGQRDFTHVDDAAATYLKVLSGKNPGILNIGRGDGISVADLIAKIQLTGINLEIEHVSRAEVKSCVANTEHLSHFTDVSTFIDPVDYLLTQVKN